VAFVVKTFLDKTGMSSRFTNNTPGRSWLKSFQVRWNQRLSMRKPEYLTMARAKGLSEKVINGFFPCLISWFQI